MSKTPDILYILGTGSRWQDLELRYSLRSLAGRYRAIWIVGACPGWLCNIRHLPEVDRWPGRKQANTRAKLRAALRHFDHDRPIILMADDIMLTRPLDAIPHWHRGPLAANLAAHPTRKGQYYQSGALTHALLADLGHDQPLDFGVHSPVQLNPREILRTIILIDEHVEPETNIHLRTVHGALQGWTGPQVDDPKLRRTWDAGPDAALPFFSLDDRILSDSTCRAQLQLRYPRASIYERTDGRTWSSHSATAKTVKGHYLNAVRHLMQSLHQRTDTTS